MSLAIQLDALRAETDPGYLAAIAEAARHLDRSGMSRRCLAPGAAAPDFALATAEGRAVSLSRRLRHGPAVVSFVRGEWCPFCRAEMDALIEAAPGMLRLGGSLLVVSSEAPSRHLAARMAALGDGVALLRDPMLGVALLYGLAYVVPDPLRLLYLGRGRDLSRDLSTGSWLLALPADYIVRTDGRISHAFADPDFTRRLEPSLIVDALRQGLGASG